MTQQPYILVVNSRVVHRPLFLIGAPHSGVEVLARALGHCAGLYLTSGRPAVLQAIYALARRPSITHGRAAGTAAMLRDAFATAWQLTTDSCPDCSPRARPGTAPWDVDATLCRHGRGMEAFGDASPDLLYSAEALALTFPDARFVQVIRDGRDAVASMLGDSQMMSWFRTDVVARLDELPHPFFGIETEEDKAGYGELSNAARCALRWRSAIRLSARLRSELAEDRMITIRYEEIPGNEVAVAERLTSFVGRGVSASELMTDTSYRIGMWRRGLDRDQYAHVRTTAGTELARLGYT
ncbi:sulfotransferase [Spiractinospora alimapuensis]|uniref:sulfotransferase family protein n=1 Tax=Spiractinospora alimapuensis TaxID=2820884 RepID=UPI001F34AD47|nr:sulfotransferase [Spiractinospora alimapuensis]QVQ53025.1 sulfotransferase [Spiractinospora alimapuensis]